MNAPQLGLLSGIAFGLLIVFVTWWLSEREDRTAASRDATGREYSQLISKGKE